MSRAGMNNYKGVTYQAWSALLLFLLKLEEGGFESVTLEDKNWEDFTLNYSGTKKIICEVKNHSRPLGKPEVKTILGKIISRKEPFNKNDAVLIICPQVKPELTRNLQYIGLFPQVVEEYHNLGFSDQEIRLLSKTSFFTAKDSAYLYEEASAYFYAKIGYWLPQNEIDGLVNTVLVKQIYEKSTKGETFTRQDLASAIDDYRQQKIQQNGVYDSEQTEIETQIKTVLDDIKNKRTTALKRDLTVLTGQPQKMFIVLDAIFELDDLELSEWDFLWAPLLDRQYASRVIFKFGKHLDNEQNSKYIVELFTKQILSLTNKASDSMHSEVALRTVQKILDQYPNLVDLIYEFCREYLSNKSADYTQLEGHRDSMEEKQLISKLILNTFNIYAESDNVEMKQSILDLIKLHFNLIEDDGEHSIYTPPQIFNIVSQYIQSDFTNNFKKIVEILVEQYKSSNYYGGSFTGWELAGGTFSQSGDHYSINDRHFITQALKPSLSAYYNENPEETWSFIVNKCVARKIKDVSAEKPDFLGRACISILLTEFKQGVHSAEAFAILKDQMLMRKGIPSKFELIFQELYRTMAMPDDKKWALTKLFLDKYKLPNSVFVEQVTSDLAITGHEGALDAIKSWVNDPEYRKQQTRHTFFVSQSMFKLLETPADSKTFLTGIEILKTYIQTDDYQKELDTFYAYDITGAIAKIIVKDFQIGIEILNEIYKSSEKLTVNQQLAISHALEQLGKEDKQLLKKAYDSFVIPIIFDDLKGDAKLIKKRFSHNYSRELIVQFAEHLAEARLYDEALALIRVFINDPNPSLQNEPEDPEGTFNYHAKILVGEENNTINTVRGWCSWALTKFMAVGGRKYLPETIGYVEQLTKDPNFYVRVQSTFPLTGLVQNRHTVMPKNKNERFVSLELANKIESIAFSMLRDKENQKYSIIMKYVAHVFGPMRSMTEDQAWEALNIFKNVSFENDIDDVYPLFVYYALFRGEAYKNPTFRELFGDELYEKINQYKSKRFEELLEEVIKTGSSDIRGRIAWQFWQLPKDSGEEFDKLYNLSYKYLKLIATTPYGRHVFGDIYYFANDYLEKKPEESLELWQLCIEEEREYLKQNEESIRQGEWWPSHYNSSMLTQMRQTLGDERYISALEILLDYPVKFDPGIDPQVAYAELKQINTVKAKNLLKNLSDNYPGLYVNE